MFKVLAQTLTGHKIMRFGAMRVNKTVLKSQQEAGGAKTDYRSWSTLPWLNPYVFR